MSRDLPFRPLAAPVTERFEERVPALVHAEWMVLFPWLVQGTTTRGLEGRSFDLGLFAGASAGHVVHENWGRLMSATGMPSAMHARQVHGADVALHGPVAPGLGLAPPCDGHATDEVGVLLAVTVADCVPVFVVAPDTRAVAVVHAGWRGVAAGVLERGLGRLTGELGADAGELHVHFGPSICGSCYEVGPEVFEALSQPVPACPAPIDLRAVLAQRAAALGVSPERMTVSTHCTRCTASPLYSHRGGDGERQVGYVGMRA